MDLMAFVQNAQELFERTGKLASPASKAIWGPLVEPLTDAQCIALLRDRAYRGDPFYTPSGFWEAACTKYRVGEVEQMIPEREDHCATCGERIVRFKNRAAWVKYRGCGGLMFREMEYGWIAVRCWTCKGPEHWKHLPIPKLEKRPHFVPINETPWQELSDWAKEQWEAFMAGQAKWETVQEACANVERWVSWAALRTLEPKQTEALAGEQA